MSQSKPGRYYAVRVGLQPGIYRSWDTCKQQVIGVKGARFKAFDSQQDAEAFIQQTEEEIRTSITRKRKLDTLEDGDEDDAKQRIKVHAPGTVVMFCDGGSRGNPGIAAGACVLFNHDRTEVLSEDSIYLGDHKTNNEAEYAGILLGLKRARALGAEHIAIYMDSKMIVKQAEGAYGVNADHLIPLYRQLQALQSKFTTFAITHIPRRLNAHADRLCNEAMDRGSGSTTSTT